MRPVTLYCFSCSACGRMYALTTLSERGEVLAAHSEQHASATFTLAVGVDP